MTLALTGLVKGKKYIVVHMSEAQRKPRESVMIFLGSEDQSTFWSARPVAGTQELPKSWIKGLWEVEQSVKVRINDPPAGSRLF